MGRTYFNHAFTIAFECLSLTDQGCRAEDMLEALKSRVREMEEDLQLPEAHRGYVDSIPGDARQALIHEACGPSYDNYEMTEEEAQAWREARNLPRGRQT